MLNFCDYSAHTGNLPKTKRSALEVTATSLLRNENNRNSTSPDGNHLTKAKVPNTNYV